MLHHLRESIRSKNLAARGDQHFLHVFPPHAKTLSPDTCDDLEALGTVSMLDDTVPLMWIDAPISAGQGFATNSDRIRPRKRVPGLLANHLCTAITGR